MMDQYPNWAQLFARKYLSKTLNQFTLHGNIRDLVITRGASDGSVEFSRLLRFLGDELFASRDIVVMYDRAGGIHFRDEQSRADFYRALPAPYSPAAGRSAEPLPKLPAVVLLLLEKYFRLRLEEGKSIACIIDYAETIVPNSDNSSSAPDDRNVLVNLLKWSQDPIFLASDFTVVMLAENLADINRSLVQSPYNAAIKIGLPSQDDRIDFIRHFFNYDAEKTAQHSVPGIEVLAQQTAGLSFVQLRSLLANAVENSEKLTFDTLVTKKKELIEAEAHDLLEFVDTAYTLDHVAGHAQVKKHLRNASQALQNGRGDVLPMGWLVCGPVGTGKTFMVSCFAGEVGVPMVKLKNFRSQWQGVTEGNLEKILTLLEAMAPVAVMIDEADAYLGDRAASGDSGVSSRVFAKIASFMSNSANRGRILWFLMTARPDLMPVDLKRQGRAEEHLALFYPDTEEERVEIFEAMKRKTGMVMTKNEVPESIRLGKHTYSGADMEAALTRARFRAAAAGKQRVSLEILEETFEDFIPPTYPEEIELQTLLAVKECTSRALLPERFRHLKPEDVAERISELKMQLEGL
ncbi:MAG: ATP-binding protein [Balneolales bacterium]|nr:ATP-binding protein [Balneolales bacterium]